MAGTGRLQADPLFLGLARPTMIFGVNYLFMVFNFALTLIAFINSSSFLSFGTFIVAHLIGYLICLKEPRSMELLVLKARTGLKCMNKRYHGNTNSYDIY